MAAFRDTFGRTSLRVCHDIPQVELAYSSRPGKESVEPEEPPGGSEKRRGAGVKVMIGAPSASQLTS